MRLDPVDQFKQRCVIIMKKTVKAVLCLVLVIGVVCTLAACGDKIVGRYDLVKMESNGQTLDVSTLKSLAGSDVDMYLELFEDGTGIMKMDGDTTHMRWADGQIWPANQENEKISFTLVDGVLTLEKDGLTLVFEK